MRPDLNKLLCEHERYNSSASYADVRTIRKIDGDPGEEFERLPMRESMTSRHKRYGRTKEFGENLNPLFGFIRTSVGKPWDKSYSELCRTFNMKSVINQHILQHLFQTVEIKTFEHEGEVCYRVGYYKASRIEPVKSKHGPEYYVHPRTGILLKNNFYRRNNHDTAQEKAEHAAKVAKTRQVIDTWTEIRRKDENSPWFICELGAMPLREHKVYTAHHESFVSTILTEASRYDHWLGHSIDFFGSYALWSNKTRERIPSYYKRGQYVKAIRSASHKEIKRYVK